MWTKWTRRNRGAENPSSARDPLGRGADDRGLQAERAAESYLCQQGLSVLERNYRCKAGEIDLIMQDGDSRVFVEVRYRRHERFGSGAETVHAGKQRKLLRAAQHYLQSKGLVDKVPCRVDVVSITGDRLQVDWIRNAF